MSSGLQMQMVRDPERRVMRCTVEIPESMQLGEVPFPPDGAWLGDQFVVLQHETSVAADTLGGLGYWRLHKEGLAMQFLRLAWYSAWAELRAQRFDGNPEPTWRREP